MFQDLLVDRLTQTVDHLREEIAMFETQCAAQLEETKAAQKALSEATTEIEVSGFICGLYAFPPGKGFPLYELMNMCSPKRYNGFLASLVSN